jgi:hypothetical protein
MLKAAVTYLLMASLAQLTGCATRPLDLIYPPEQSATAIPSSPVIENTGSINSNDIVLDLFDARTVKDRLGTAITGVRGYVFESEDNVVAWVNNALVYELTEVGYNVFQKGTATTSDAAIGLTVDIQNVFVTAPVTYQGEVLLQATLHRKGEQQVTQQFEGTGSAGLNMATTSRSLGKSLALALQDAISKMLVDFELIQPPENT